MATGVSMDECDICGGEHYTEQCPELGIDEKSFQLSTRARSTLPNNLDLQEFTNGIVSVVATATIPAKTRFGPLDAQRLHDDKDIANGFVLKVVGRGPTMTFDTSNEDQSNWMILVRTADSELTQNLMAFQVGHDIYFSTLKDIETGTELRVWYAKHYAKKLSKPIKPDPNIKPLLYMQADWQEQIADQTITIYITENDGVTAESNQQQEEAIEPPSHTDEAYIDDINDPDYEPSRQKTRWKMPEVKQEPFFGAPSNQLLEPLPCTRCDKLFYDKAELARHIQEHLKVHFCTLCQMSFFQLAALKTHMKKFHRNPMDGSTSKASTAAAAKRKMTKIKKEQISDDDEEIESSTPSRKKKRHVSPSPPTRSHGYSTRGIRLDMARLAGIKKEPESSDDEEPTPRRKKTAVTSPVKRGRGRPRKSDVFTPSKAVSDLNIRKPQMLVEKVENEGAETEGACQQTVKEVIDAVVDKVESSTNVVGENVKISDDNEEQTNNGETVEVRKQTETGETVDENVGGETKKLDVENEAENEDDEVDVDVDDEAGGDEDISDLEKDDENDEVGNNEENVAPEMTEDEIAGYDLEKGGLTIDRELLDIKANDRKQCYIVYALRKLEGGQPEDTKEEDAEPMAGLYYECRACDMFFSRAAYVEKHVHELHGFVCSYCCKSFRKDIPYQVHRCRQMVEDVKADEHGVFHCPECSKKFSNIDTLYPHLFGHRRKLECRLCKRSFMRKETYWKHACPAKLPVEKSHKCDICSMSFSTAKYLFRHLAAHTERFKCNQCGHSFSRKQSLLSHINKCNPKQFRAMGISAFPCKVCNRVFSEQVKLDNHMVMHEGKYQCNICFKKFTNMNTMSLHSCFRPADKIPDRQMLAGQAYDAIVEDGIYGCKICNRQFPTEKVLEKHMSTHTEKLVCEFCSACFQHRVELSSHVITCRAAAILEAQGKISCETCYEDFSTCDDYSRHIGLAHTQPFKCNSCERAFRSLLKKIEHQRICLKLTNEQLENAVCQSCGKMFNDTDCLARHMLVHQRLHLHCDDCGKDFYRRDYYNRHLCRRADGTVVQVQRSKYEGSTNNLTPHMCHLCGNSYASYGNLNKHLLRHGEKTVPCPICEKMFHLGSAMKEHLKHVHNTNKCAQCPHCGKMMKSKNSLGAHIKQFHKDNVMLYPCSECGKTFRQRGNMTKHMLMHSTHRSYNCPYCTKSFKYPEQLHKHKLEHEQGRQFHCEDCNRWFVKDYELRKHNLTFHSGITYTCEFCPTDCRHLFTLKRHIRKRHPERLYLLNDVAYLRSLQRVATETASLPYQRSRSTTMQDDTTTTPPTTGQIQTIRILQPGGADDGQVQEMEIQLAGMEPEMQEVTIQEIQNNSELHQVHQLVTDGNEADGQQTVSIEFMSQEAAEVLQSLSTTSGLGEVQTMSLSDLTQLTGEQGATHVLQQDSESQEYILVPLIHASSEQTETVTSN